MDKKRLLEKCHTAFDLAGRQVHSLVETHPDYFPTYTKEGKWKHGGETWANWCSGFLAGELWLLYQHTGDAWWREKAEHYCKLMEHRKNDQTTHDLGFLFWPSWKYWYDLTGDEAINRVVIEAGRTQALRLKKGGYLCSAFSENSLFIDIMMNIGIVFYAAEQTQDEKLWQIANQHCLITRRTLVRGDGSVAHEGIFDLETGEFLHQSTHQGWRNDSAWVRGLTWALYGFGTAYQFTGDARFLYTAETCANYYIEHTPDSGVPPNDWDEPNPALPTESSAAATAAAGLWNLSKLTRDSARAHFYSDYACRIIDTLTTPDFLAVETPGWEGILKHAIYHQRLGLGVDESVMWGEYFFLEAITKIIEDESSTKPKLDQMIIEP